MNKDVKEKCLKLLGAVDSEDPVVITLRDFLETYEGTNEEDIKLLCLGVVGLLMKIEDLSIMAAGFERMEEISNETNSLVEDLRKEWKKIDEDELPSEPPAAVFMEDVPKEEEE